MPAELQIKPSKIKNKNSLIQPTLSLKSESVSFNFSRINEGPDGQFKYTDRGSCYFSKLIQRLKDCSTMTKEDILRRSGSRDSLRVHPIDWNDRRCSLKSFGLPAAVGQDADDEAFQISLSRTNGRVHGYFVTNTFHIVWIDPRHNLYPGLEDMDLEACSLESDQDIRDADLIDCRIKLAEKSKDNENICKEYYEHLESCSTKPNTKE